MTIPPTMTLRIFTLALTLLTQGLQAHAFPETNALSCSHVETWDGTGPDAFTGQASAILNRLPHSTQEYLRRVATGFHPKRSLSVQQALFREDLIWQGRGLTERQLDLMVFVAVALSLDTAADQAVRLCRSLEQKNEPQLKKQAANVTRYRSRALALLDELSPRLSNVADYELGIYFQP